MKAAHEGEESRETAADEGDLEAPVRRDGAERDGTEEQTEVGTAGR